MNRKLTHGMAFALLLLGCNETSVTPLAEEVSFPFTGTITTVFYGGGIQPPAGVEKGKPVTGAVSYVPDSAQLLN